MLTSDLVPRNARARYGTLLDRWIEAQRLYAIPVERATGSGARRPRNGEAILQHSEASDLAAGDRQHEGEGRLHGLARTLHSGCEFTDDHRTTVIGQNIVDLDAEWFDQAADITEKVSRGATSDPPSDPRQPY